MSEADKDRKIPFALIGVGLVLYTVAGFVRFRAKGPAPVLAVVAVGCVVGVALMLAAAFITAKITGTSFGELGSAVLKLAAIYLFPSAVGLFVPGIVGGLVASVIAFVLLMWLFELELPYAIIFTIVTWVVNFVAALAVGVVIA